MRLTPLICQRVLVILVAVAIQLGARVRDPVVPAPASTRVSVVIAIVMLPAEVSLMKVIAVQTGKATDELAGIVQVRAVVSADG